MRRRTRADAGEGQGEEGGEGDSPGDHGVSCLADEGCRDTAVHADDRFVHEDAVVDDEAGDLHGEEDVEAVGEEELEGHCRQETVDAQVVLQFCDADRQLELTSPSR